MSMSQQWRITAAEAGGRLDRSLARWLDLSRRQVLELFDRGRVRLNGRAVGRDAKGRHLMVDDRLEVLAFERPEAQRVVPEPGRPLHVVSEGAGWLIADKPAGMPVHPLRAEETGTLLNAVMARYPQIHGVGEAGLRSGVVHRLDITTSGAVLFALDELHWQRLREAFRGRAVHKRYEAVVRGQLTGEGREVLPLVIHQHHPARVRVAGSTRGPARRCALRWRALEMFADATHLGIDLETGFLHQIRVMLAHRGHPILGDAVYGDAGPTADAPADSVERPMLHARRLAFEAIAGECEPPDDFQQLVRRLRRGTPAE